MEFLRIVQINLMKYVWASWQRKKPTGELLILGTKTRKLPGYGCAVTFSSARMEWSVAQLTYNLQLKTFESSFCHA